MEQEKIFKLFKQFAGDVIDLLGLKLSLTAVGKRGMKVEQNIMYFDIFNPNKLSYFTPLVADDLNDIVESFEGYVNEKFYVEFDHDVNKGVFFNDKLLKEIKQVFDDLPFIYFQVQSSKGPIDYRIYGKTTAISTNWGSDDFSINNIFKPTKATCDGEVADIEEVLEYYDDFLSGVETYWESENLYSELDLILTDYPLLHADWVATYYHTKFKF